VTTLVKVRGLGGALVTEHRTESPHDGARALLARLHEESDRQVPFSQAKLLFREAAAAIERLEGELARVGAELATERTARVP
jgi:hypothetical protein